MPNSRYTREERKEMIVLALTIMAQHGLKPEATAYTIARKLDMNPSMHLYGLLSDMVAEARLSIRWESLGARGSRTWYRLPEGSYEMPSEERTINLKIRGKLYQEVLF